MPSPLECIEHVVVLMMENRSFDHMLGFLPREGHLRGVEGLTGGEYNLADPADPNSQKFFVARNACFELETMARGLGPAHDFGDVNRQLTNDRGGPSPTRPVENNGFVAAWIESLKCYLAVCQPALDPATQLRNITIPPTHAEIARVMECFTPTQLPVLSTLAREFVLCDHWFCSIPGPTMPNRLFIQAATSGGYAHNAFCDRFAFRTIYQNLAEAGKTWSVYHQNSFDIIMNFTDLHYGSANDPDDLKLRDFSLFEQDIAHGKLAQYSFINPRFIEHWNDLTQDVELANSQHAPCDVRQGEVLIAEVYNALRANESVWKKTLLVVTYDEHGGFYDHVPPPTGVRNPDGKISTDPPFDFTRLGLRVPAILVSPWLPKMVDSTVYEHSSVLATVKKLFNLPDFLTERDRHANSFEHLFEHARFRHDTPEKLVPLRPPKVGPGTRMGRLLDEVQKEIMQGIVSHLAPGEEQGLSQDHFEDGKIALDKLTVQQASALTSSVISKFKERVVANDGLHPDNTGNLRIGKPQTVNETESHGRTRTRIAGQAPENSAQTVGTGGTDQKS